MMTTRTILSLGASALILGGTMVGCTASSGGAHLASASSRSADVSAKTAALDADTAQRALARHDGARAVAAAESAVALAPRNAGYRTLLGQGYLAAGRFASARTALGDALALAPDDGRTALNLALAQVACGDWADARATLTAHEAQIAATDRGLALALAGDPAGGAAILTTAARTPGASVKTRQNLALALALAGQWQAARIVASADMAPADVDQRIEQWAAFAQPKGAADQVSALLGVTPVADAGQPVALALNTPAPIAVAAEAATVSPAAGQALAAETPAPAALVVAAPPVVAAAPPLAPALAAVVFGPRNPVVQPLPVRQAALIRAAAAPARVALGHGDHAPAAAGSFYIQLGAFQSAGVAKDAWGRATRRMPVLAAHNPNGMTFASRHGAVYRLSIGGFTRGDADALCHSYRAKGGACFVRTGAGDNLAEWVHRGGTQMASR